jgi:hypothetical protein
MNDSGYAHSRYILELAFPDAEATVIETEFLFFHIHITHESMLRSWKIHLIILTDLYVSSSFNSAYLSVCVCMYVCMYICVYVRMYVSMYMYI